VIGVKKARGDWGPVPRIAGRRTDSSEGDQIRGRGERRSSWKDNLDWVGKELINEKVNGDYLLKPAHCSDDLLKRIIVLVSGTTEEVLNV